MKIVNVLISCVLITGLAASCGSTRKTMNDTKTQDDAWISLFDGKTTTGWRGYNKTAFPDKGWEVVDGTLHCIESGTGEAGLGGDIIFDRKFSNFELTLEWKIGSGGNSGIFFLAQEIAGEPIYKSSPEMQVLDNDRHPDAKLGVNGNRMAGSLYDLIPAVPQIQNRSVNGTRLEFFVTREQWCLNQTVLMFWNFISGPMTGKKWSWIPNSRTGNGL